jgi:putative FmdB family regulatory protein
MPLYEYGCAACGHELEVLQKLSADPLSDCPACGEPALRRKISVVGFRLKGSGWYETDFKTGDKKKNIVKEEAPSSDASPMTTDDTRSGKGGTEAAAS